MTVYVDELFFTPRSRRWRFDQACHLMADTLDELHAFATELGLQQSWFQGDHYDLTASRRRVAVAAGAEEVSGRVLIAVRKRLRVEAAS